VSLRIVYMGTPDFAVPALDALVDAGHHVIGVFTNPDRKSGRGKKVRQTPVKKAALRHDVDVFQPKKVRGNDEAYERLAAWEPEVAVVAAYGQILPQRFLDLPEHGCINIHASLLPKYRGAAPINWCIIRGETETGITTMQMEAGLDTGPMLLQRSTPIGELETAGELHDRLSEMGADLIVETLEQLEAGTLEATPQDDDEATYAPMMSKEDGRIDWSEPAADVANLIRGVNPWPGGFTFHDDDRIKLHLARPVEGDGRPGEIIVADRKLVVAAGAGAVDCLELQAPGKRAMDALDFLNGYELHPGEVLA
jgi:methionyl-tRNA formyltransferase